MPDIFPRTKNDAKASSQGNATISIGAEVNAFVKQTDSLLTSLLLAMKVMTTVRDKVSESLKGFFDKHGTLVRETDGYTFYSVGSEHASQSENLKKQLDHAESALAVLPRSFLVSLSAQFEVYLARLIRAMYYLKPELLDASDNALSFAKLLELQSIDAAKEYLLEKEIELILRKSTAEQFTWLENKFGVSLKKEFVNWPVFIEIMECSDHVVYRNGVVSERYIAVCKEFGVRLGNAVAVGEALPVGPEYFDTACRSLYEMGVKLAHLLWRKFKPEDLEEADKNLIAVTHDLIAMEKYRLAIALLDFAVLTLKSHFNEETRRTFIINRAQAYKWNKQENLCSLILSREDWVGHDDKLQLAVAVLSDNFVLAARLMEKIGQDDAHEAGYREWPLFREFRKSSEFHQAYEKIYSRKFVKIEQVPKHASVANA